MVKLYIHEQGCILQVLEHPHMALPVVYHVVQNKVLQLYLTANS